MMAECEQLVFDPRVESFCYLFESPQIKYIMISFY